jgi:hypothetical protein
VEEVIGWFDSGLFGPSGFCSVAGNFFAPLGRQVRRPRRAAHAPQRHGGGFRFSWHSYSLMLSGKLRKEADNGGNRTMRTAAFAFVAVGVLMSGPSHAACAKPDIPACAVEKGAFPSGADYDQCRMQMISYKREAEAHSLCVKDAGQPQEQRSADEELETTLAQFNRRARGE